MSLPKVVLNDVTKTMFSFRELMEIVSDQQTVIPAQAVLLI